jgi:hypothetical protein
MVAWIARGLLVGGGFVTSWFVAVGLLLLTLVVSVIAFWPSSWTARLNRTD